MIDNCFVTLSLSWQGEFEMTGVTGPHKCSTVSGSAIWISNNIIFKDSTGVFKKSFIIILGSKNIY